MYEMVWAVQSYPLSQLTDNCLLVGAHRKHCLADVQCVDNVVAWQDCEPSGLARPAHEKMLMTSPWSSAMVTRMVLTRAVVRRCGPWLTGRKLSPLRRAAPQLLPPLLTGMSVIPSPSALGAWTLRQGVMALLILFLELPPLTKGHIILGSSD